MKKVKLLLRFIGSLLAQTTPKWRVFALVIFVIFCFFYNRMFSIYLPDHRTWYAIGILSLCMVAPASGLYFLPYFFRERALFQSADNPSIIDGKRVAIHGKLESTEQPILTPFTKNPCLYYIPVRLHSLFCLYNTHFQMINGFRCIKIVSEDRSSLLLNTICCNRKKLGSGARVEAI